ncbi:MAG: hypothetical protein KY467_12765 [Gemmatimonadetes bacterium]|nr:hypothetical protein [Gemmatimonadota bacterium]
MNLHRWSVAVGLGFVCACGAAASGERDGGFPGEAARHRAASPVAEVWTSPPEAELVSFSHLAVDSRGNVYVPDFYRNRVVVFGPDGRVLRTVGKRGRGPGEFQAIRSVQVLRGDSLLVYDGSLARVNVFPPGSDQEAYVVTLRDAAPWALERTPDNGAYLARYEPGFQFGQGTDTGPRLDRVRVLNLDGTRRADLLSFPARSFVVSQQSVTPNPWGHNGFVRLDSKNRLHYVWSDTVGATTYDLQGQRLGSFRVDYAPPPVTRADLERELSTVPEPMLQRFRAALEDSLPSRWPAVRALLVDDEDRLWLELAGPVGREVEWVAFSPGGEYRGSLLLPAGTSVYQIRGSSVYAKKEGEYDTARLTVYRMVRPPR